MCFSASDYADCDRERLKWYTYSKCGSGIFSVRAHLEIHPGNNIYWGYTGPAGARRGSPVEIWEGTSETWEKMWEDISGTWEKLWEKIWESRAKIWERRAKIWGMRSSALGHHHCQSGRKLHCPWTPFKSHQVDEFEPGGLIFVTFCDFGFHLVKIRFYRLGFENTDCFGMH